MTMYDDVWRYMLQYTICNMYVTIMYVAMYYICDSVWRYMAARFESNKKKLYIGFIGERESAEYIATSNIRSFYIFFFWKKSP